MHAIGAEMDVYRPLPPREPVPEGLPADHDRERRARGTPEPGGVQPYAPPTPADHYGAPRLSDVAPVRPAEPPALRRVIQRVELAPFRGRLIDLVM